MARTGLLVAASLVSLLSAGPVPAAEKEPLFTRHIVPLFSRLGCNAGACHGAVQGKGDFRLSLFGVDPTLDHQQLLAKAAPRVDVKDPDASLLLLKPTGETSHKGGKLIKA